MPSHLPPLTWLELQSMVTHAVNNARLCTVQMMCFQDLQKAPNSIVFFFKINVGNASINVIPDSSSNMIRDTG